MCKNISHAVAYCETFIRYSEPGERSEFDMMKGAVDIPTESAVSVLKETVVRKDIIGAEIILKEMNTPEFKSYLARFMNCE